MLSFEGNETKLTYFVEKTSLTKITNYGVDVKKTFKKDLQKGLSVNRRVFLSPIITEIKLLFHFPSNRPPPHFCLIFLRFSPIVPTGRA